MTRVLVVKILRDIWVGLIVVCALLFLFEMLWARVTYVIAGDLVKLAPIAQFLPEIEKTIFKGPGQIIKTIMGGERVDIRRVLDMYSIGFVHPVVQIILVIWAVGKGSGAIAGEIDRGTMELLMAQPVPRRTLILAHFTVDMMVLPLLCLSIWLGGVTGLYFVDMLNPADEFLRVNPFLILPALVFHALLVFSLSGVSLWFSAAGRFRYRVLGLTVLGALLMFLTNILGQLWDAIQYSRFLTVFYYFDPQTIILDRRWYADPLLWFKLSVLLGLGITGYVMALRTFCRRDLPAPL